MKFEENMDILISYLFLESVLEFGKWYDWKYANYANWRNLRIFNLTTLQSQKVIQKVDLKWKGV